MQTVRSISRDELATFAAIGAAGDSATRAGQMVSSLWERGLCQPESCFLLEVGSGQRTGRLLYHRSDPEDLSGTEWWLTGLRLPWEGDWLGGGRALLEQSAEAMRGLGAETLRVQVQSSAAQATAERTLYGLLRWSLVQEKCRYSLDLNSNASGLLSLAPRLRFRSLAEVGRAAFEEAIGLVTEGTLDRVDAEGLRKSGREAAGKQYFALLAGMELEADWWQLAYDAEGKLAGLLVPQRFRDGVGVVNYIGVTPEQRGRGYVRELLGKGAELLAGAGMRSVLADIDQENAPMAKALQALGYQRERQIWIFEKVL